MINIAEKLKDCPKGYKLYSPLFGEVTLEQVGSNIIIILTFLGCKKDFNQYGQYFTGYSTSECLLFPSKSQRDWSKFNPKKEIIKETMLKEFKAWFCDAYCSFYKKQEYCTNCPIHKKEFWLENE